MLTQYVQEGRGLLQRKMWIQIIIGIIVWIVIVYYGLKIIDEAIMKKKRRGYNPNEDKGRKFEAGKFVGEGIGYRDHGKPDERKPELQDAIEHAKQELLQGGVSGSITSDSTDISSTKSDARRKTRRSKQDIVK